MRRAAPVALLAAGARGSAPPVPTPPPAGGWALASEWRGTPAQHQSDNGKSAIESFFTLRSDDATQGFPNSYAGACGGAACAGDDVAFVDATGRLTIHPQCPTKTANGSCAAVRCGGACTCDSEVTSGHIFPWWCQSGWRSTKLVSKNTFSLSGSGSLVVFQNVTLPTTRPLWPALWLLPETDPVYGGKGSPAGGDWSTWPNNGEIDVMEAMGGDPHVYGTLHYTSSQAKIGWPGIAKPTFGPGAVKGSAYVPPPRPNGVKEELLGNILTTRGTGDNIRSGAGRELGSLILEYAVTDDGPEMTWWQSADPEPVKDGVLNAERLDVLINREGTDGGDGTGKLRFDSTPFWPGAIFNSPAQTLYKGWDGSNSYGFQGYYKPQGNVVSGKEGVHVGAVSAANPNGLGAVPKFDANGRAINGTIDELYEPWLCSMMGDWLHPSPLPYATQPCANPPPGADKSACPMDGKGGNDTYNYCRVEGATKPGVGWWSNSPKAAGVPYAPFDASQRWNIVINVAVGGEFPRDAGQEGGWDEDFAATEPLKLAAVSIYNKAT